MAQGIPARLSATEGRSFAWTVGTAFLALAAVAWWRSRPLAYVVLGALGAVLWVAGLAVPGRLGPLKATWMRLAHAISLVTTPVFLGVVFFLVIAPIGLVMRLSGRSPIRHQPVESSFWFRRTDESSDLRRQF